MGYFRYTEKLQIYRRRLPHWKLEGGIYFVTARLSDSLEPKRIDRMRRTYAEGLERLRRRSPSAEAFESFYEWFHLAKYDAALDDGHGACPFLDDRLAEILWSSIHHFDGERYELIAVVIMPNHIHVVFRPLPGYTFEKIVGAWKSFSYNEIRKKFDMHVTWQEECFDRIVRDMDELYRVVEYVLDNPRKAGLSDWKWVGRFMELR